MDILMWIVKPFIFFTLGHHYNGTSGQEIVLLISVVCLVLLRAAVF